MADKLKLRLQLSESDEWTRGPSRTEFAEFEVKRASEEGWYQELSVTINDDFGQRTISARVWIDGREGMPPGFPTP
jgi:hypothetical protein